MHVLHTAIGTQELKIASDAGERDGEAVGMAYAGGVQRGLDRAFSQTAPQLLGRTPGELAAITDDILEDHLPPLVLDVPPEEPEPTPEPAPEQVEDYTEFSRPELMRMCKEREPVVKTERTDTVSKLRAKLRRADKRRRPQPV